jgi:hypothetical protein
LGEPSYVITAWFDAEHAGERATSPPARWSEQVRRGEGSHADNTVAALTGSREAAVALALGPEHADPHDVEVAARVDAVNFAMETCPTRQSVVPAVRQAVIGSSPATNSRSSASVRAS